MQKIFFDDIKKDRFENGKEELYVVFKDENKNEYKWRPMWIEHVIRLVDEASNTEALNYNQNSYLYLNEFANVAKRVYARVQPGESRLRVGFLLETKGNKIVVTKPQGYVNNPFFGLANELSITNTEEFTVGFDPTSIRGLIGKNLLFYILNGTVIKVAETQMEM